MIKKEENDFIKKHWKEMTDKQMGAELGLEPMTVRNRRNKMKLTKPLNFFNPII